MNIKQLYIHIGAAKTGSSAIQSMLRINRKIFYNKGYLIFDANMDYANLEKDASDISAVWYFEKIKKDNLEKKFIAQINDSVIFMHEHGLEKAIISAENLSNKDYEKIFHEIRNKLNIKVIFYIRRQDYWLFSAWKQWQVKKGKSFEKFVHDAIKIKYPNWLNIANSWENIFGKESVQVRLFDKTVLTKQDLLQDFCRCIDFEETNILSMPGYINENFNDAVLYLAQCNPHLFSGIHDNRFYHFLQKELGDKVMRDKVGSLFLTNEIKNRIYTAFLKDNEVLKKKYFPDLNQDIIPQKAKPINEETDNIEELKDKIISYLLEIIENKTNNFKN